MTIHYQNNTKKELWSVNDLAELKAVIEKLGVKSFRGPIFNKYQTNWHVNGETDSYEVISIGEASLGITAILEKEHIARNKKLFERSKADRTTYKVKEIHEGRKYLSSLPYGFTGGYFSPNSDRAMTFTSIEAASKAGNACFNCAKLMVIDQDNKPVKNLHE